jgi:glyoxylase-like metal-dependent hydrolase (beta-lactamase superfamily II)
MELHSLETGNLMLDGGALFGVVPKSIWSKLYPADENNLCNLSMRALLIKDAGRTILIDCGMGEKMDPSLLKYYFLNGDDTLHRSLAAAGVSPGEVTDVVLTHLHFDHCGGAVASIGGELVLTFPNAQHWVGAAQWHSAMHPNARERSSFLPDNFLPIERAGKLRLVEGDMQLTEHVSLRQFHGHTAGQIIAQINYCGQILVYVADFIPSSVHVPVSYVCGYDTSPLVTMEETQAYLEEALAGGYTFFFEHDIYTECCTLAQGKRGPVVGRRLSLEDFKREAAEQDSLRSAE